MKIDSSSHIPIYLQIKDQLQTEIQETGLKSGDPLPTLAGICKKAKVSMRTAQRAVEAMLNEGIGKRLGRQLVVGDTPQRFSNVKSVYIVCFDFALNQVDWISNEILNGIREAVALESDSEVVLAAPDFVQSLRFYLSNPAMRVGGVIMLHCQQYSVLENLCRQYPQIRFMQINYYLEEIETLPENLLGVFNDDFAGSYMAVDYLLEQAGCQKPIFWELDSLDQVYQERRRGFLSALRDHGLDGRAFRQQHFTYHGTHEILTSYYNFFASLYEQAGDLDGVLCCNDFMAAAAAEYLEDHGRKEIAIIGYDNYIYPSFRKLSTIGIDYARMGRIAVQRLRQPSGLRFSKLLPQLIIRNAQPPAKPETFDHVFQIFNARSVARGK